MTPDPIQWAKHAVLACFLTVPISLAASLLAGISGWYAWPWPRVFAVAVVTALVVVIVEAILALWDWASN